MFLREDKNCEGSDIGPTPFEPPLMLGTKNGEIFLSNFYTLPNSIFCLKNFNDFILQYSKKNFNIKGRCMKINCESLREAFKKKKRSNLGIVPKFV